MVKTKQQILSLIAVVILSTILPMVCNEAKAKRPENTHSTTYTGAIAASGVEIYRLESGEEFVYGKIGLKSDGDFNYSFAIVRKPNPNKTIYAREFEPYGPRPIMGGGKMKLDQNPQEFDRYDFWVIFNGQKFGPYDRIVEIHQDNANIDTWVSKDGKRISFAGVKGQMYEAIIANNKAISFWNAIQAPIFDPLSGINSFAFLWSKDNFKFYEKGVQVSADWKLLSKVSYSDNGDNIVYVGAKDSKHEQNIYLNHKKIAGPYYIVSQAGFIPNTNIVYYSGFQEKIIDNTVEYNYEYVAIGHKRVIIPDGHSVGNFHFTNSKVSFTVTEHNKAYKGNDPFKRDKIKVYEYNYLTDEMIQHEGYARTLQTTIVGNTFFYTTYNSNSDAIVVMEGGAIIDKVSRADMGKEGVAFFKVSPSGAVYTYYQTNYSSPYKMRKDGAPFPIAGTKISWVEDISYNPTTNEDNIIIAVDAPVGAKQRRLLKGSSSFELYGDTWASNVHFAKKGKVFYSVHRDIISSNNWRFLLYKNGKPTDDKKWTSITSFCMSDDGEQYAMLVTESDITGAGASTENNMLHIPKRMILNGAMIHGKYGNPTWSSSSGSFLVIREENGALEIIEL